MTTSSRVKSGVEIRTASWKQWRDQVASSLEKKTGKDVAAWNRRVRAQKLGDEKSLRAWLAEEGIAGYAATLLVWERFGYPDFIAADVDKVIDGQYPDRPSLRPILDAVLDALPGIGSVTIQARKTYISLVSPRRTFAVVQPTTKTRVDLGLRLDSQKPGGKLLAARGVGSDAINLRIGLSSPTDFDKEAMRLLQRAYDASL